MIVKNTEFGNELSPEEEAYNNGLREAVKIIRALKPFSTETIENNEYTKITIPIQFADLQMIKSDIKMHYRCGTNAGYFRCENCGKHLGRLVTIGFNKQDPDKTRVFGYFIPEHKCKNMKTYKTGFSETTIYDLLKNMRKADITDDEWHEIKSECYAKRNQSDNEK